MKMSFKWLALMGLIINIFAFSAWGCAQNDKNGQSGRDILLPTPAGSLDTELVRTLKSRHSTRDFQDREVSLKDLSTVLWAGDGVNRENGKRTAPTPFGKYVIDIYVTMKEGVFLYQPNENKLRLIADDPINNKAGMQGDTKKASHLLILIGKPNEFPFFVKKEGRISMINAAAGCIAQNIYLAANAMGLGTRLVEGINAKAIQSGLRLKKDEVPLYIMPLGYPKE